MHKFYGNSHLLSLLITVVHSSNKFYTTCTYPLKLVMGIIYYLLFDLKSIILSIEKNSWLENTIDTCFFVHTVLYSVLCPVQCTLSCTVYIVLEAGTKFAIDDLHADPYFKFNQTWNWSYISYRFMTYTFSYNMYTSYGMVPKV